MNAITEIALGWLKQNIAPIPCHYRSKLPRVQWQQYQTILPTMNQVHAWFASEQTNLAVVCGWQGLVVIDFDSFDAYDLWLSWVAQYGGVDGPEPIFDRTRRVVTGRGVHLFLFVDEPVMSSHVQNVVDIKATGYVTTVPSIHPSGKRYITNGQPIVRVPTLHGIIPDEWLQHPSEAKYQAPPILSNPLSSRPLDRCDQQMPVITAIKQHIKIQDMLEVKPTRDGWFVAKCPFHDDIKPSFWIDTHRQICGCHAGCTPRPFDVINLYARLNGISNGDAIQSLSRML